MERKGFTELYRGKKFPPLLIWRKALYLRSLSRKISGVKIRGFHMAEGGGFSLHLEIGSFRTPPHLGELGLF